MNREKELVNTTNNARKNLLLHAYFNVPFYSQRFDKAEIIQRETVKLNRFSRLPLLTRDDIRSHMNELMSREIGRRKWYYDFSGGSTGEPIRFIRDEVENKWRHATFRYYYETILGIDEIAAKKVLLWGSANDVLKGTLGSRAKLINWLTNIAFLNCFRMNENDMERFVKRINSYKPDLIRGYACALYELANFIDRKGRNIHQPLAIVSTAEKLQSYMRQKIEGVLGAKVYNYFGSREVNGIAGECNAGLLHIFRFYNYVEVLSELPPYK